MKTTVYLLNAFDYVTKEFVPLGVFSESKRDKIIASKPWTERYFLKYTIDKMDWDVVRDYNFNIHKGDIA